MVLAAGKGTRLFPLTGEIPKPMAPVVGKPIIQHIFELLAETGLEEVHANVHYLADTILDAYGETVTPPRTGKRGRPKAPYKVAPPGLTHRLEHDSAHP